MQISIDNFIAELFGQIHELLTHFVYGGYHALANYLQYPVGLLIALYVAIMGISINQGWINFSVQYLVKNTLKISLIYMFALNWSFFSENGLALLTQGTSTLSDVILQSLPGQISSHGTNGIVGILQTSLSEYTRLGLEVWDEGSWHAISFYIIAAAFWIYGGGVVAIATAELLEATICMAILLTMAPIFVVFALFSSTKSLFDRWMSSNVGYALVILFISVALSFVFFLSQWFISGFSHSEGTSARLEDICMIIVMCVLSFKLLLNMRSNAISIGMGTSSGSSSASAVMGAAAGWIGNSIYRYFRGKNPPSSPQNTEQSENNSSNRMNNIHHQVNKGDIPNDENE